MLIARSLLFNALFYLNLLIWLVAALPLLALPRRLLMRTTQAWARMNLWLLRVVAGIRAEFRGLERIPSGACLVAAKHQSLWETFALLTLFDDPAFVLKRELMWIPLFGWSAWKADMVPVDRSGGSAALTAMYEHARKAVRQGRQILIFPEGTRRPPGAEAAYKSGIAHLYCKLDVPCLPVALNSGLFWPRRRFLRRPGTIVVEVLEPIAPGLSRKELMSELQARIEAASDRLLREGEEHMGSAAQAHLARDRSVL